MFAIVPICHELADHVGRFHAELVGEILNGDGFLHLDDAFLRLGFGDLRFLDLFAQRELLLLGKENHFLLAVIGKTNVFRTNFRFAAAAAFFRCFFLGHLVEVFLRHLDDAEAVRPCLWQSGRSGHRFWAPDRTAGLIIGRGGGAWASTIFRMLLRGATGRGGKR